MPELILIRHGETDANKALRFQGHTDIPLNTMGQLQSDRLAKALRDNGILDRVVAAYSSDLQRAAKTAETALHQLPLQARLLTELREQSFGILEGLTMDEARLQHADILHDWMRFDPDYQLPHGESLRRFHQRTLGALTGIAQAHADMPADGCILVFSHGGVVDIAWRTLTGQSLAGPRTVEIPNVGLNHMRWDGSQFQLLHWADARHVADLPSQPRYDQTRLQVPASDKENA